MRTAGTDGSRRRWYRLRGLWFPPENDPGGADAVDRWIRRTAGSAAGDVGAVRIIRRSLDVRRKNRPRFIYQILVELGPGTERILAAALRRRGQPVPTAEPDPGEARAVIPGDSCGKAEVTAPAVRTASREPVAVVGSGPAGLFAALRLSADGCRVTLFERGDPVEERTRRVQAMREGGPVDPESNVQFGEGGAGTFSDGKLYSGTRDRRRGEVFRVLVELGAPPDILYEAKPHVGTDILRTVVRAFRGRLENQGCRIRYRCRVTELLRTREGRLSGLLLEGGETFDCRRAVLAVGHSARDTFRMLARLGLRLRFKPFAAGFRVEHPQAQVNRIQYGPKGAAGGLPPAEYRLSVRTAEGRGVYTFCMCPGGEVVAASSEPGQSVTNGMSFRDRAGYWANSGIVAAVDESCLEQDPAVDPLAGLAWQEKWERQAFVLGGSSGAAPAQRMTSFLDGRLDGCLPESSFRPGVLAAPLDRCLDDATVGAIRQGLRLMDRKMRGFITGEGLLIGVETRTSSPIRIPRDTDGQSADLPGLYPAGEGSGYAGGIVSSAVDGLRAAEALEASLPVPP